MHCIFAPLTNTNILGKLPIRDSNNGVNWKLLSVDLQKYNTHVTAKDRIYEQDALRSVNSLGLY